MGQGGSNLAYQMMVVSLGWQVYDLTNSAFYLGLTGLMQFLPQFLLTLPAGHLADRYNRRRIAYMCQLLECVVTAVLAIASYTHWISVEIVYACAIALGAARTFEQPCMQAILPSLVEPAAVSKAVAWMGVVKNSAQVIGPPLGGVIFALGANAAYATSSLFFLAAAILVFGVNQPFQARRREPNTLRTVLAGIAYIWSKPVILGAITLDLFAVLLGGATALLPIYARDILHTGPWGLGILRAAPAMGAIPISIWLARNPMNRHVGYIMFGAVASFGIATVIFGFSTFFPLSFAALMLLGASDMVSVVIRMTLIQIETPDEMRGRVSAVNSIFIGTSNQLGEFESGTTASWFGTVPAVVLGGVGTLLVVILGMRWFPALAKRQTLLPGDGIAPVPEKTADKPATAVST